MYEENRVFLAFLRRFQVVVHHAITAHQEASQTPKQPQTDRKTDLRNEGMTTQTTQKY